MKRIARALADIVFAAERDRIYRRIRFVSISTVAEGRNGESVFARVVSERDLRAAIYNERG